MGKSVLYVPKEDLKEVIEVIRAGLKSSQVPQHVRDGLTQWCDSEEQYIKRPTKVVSPDPLPVAIIQAHAELVNDKSPTTCDECSATIEGLGHNLGCDKWLCEKCLAEFLAWCEKQKSG